jgi:putative Mg2+ transporter-C (MgtC) family protein
VLLDSSWIDQLQIIGLVGLSMVLGGIIGLERERADKPAGLRTHMLVSGAATTLVILADLIVAGSSVPSEIVRTDPVRIIEAIVAGVAFLGAGTIIRRQMEVEGLTTAASLLFVAALGIAVALHQFVLAIGAVLLTLLVLVAVRYLDRWLGRSSSS